MPTPTATQILQLLNMKFVKVDDTLSKKGYAADSKAVGAALSKALPSVTTGDKGKILFVDDSGKWVAGSIVVQGGNDTSDATATEDDILAGVTSYANGKKLTGAIESYEDGELVLVEDKTETSTSYYTLKVGDEISIPYEGSSPTVECPKCLTYYDDGGELIFTAKSLGTGTIRIYDSDTLIAEYTVTVTETATDVCHLKVGDIFSVVYDYDNVSVEYPKCLAHFSYGTKLIFVAQFAGTGTIRIFSGDRLLGVCNVTVTQSSTAAVLGTATLGAMVLGG